MKKKTAKKKTRKKSAKKRGTKVLTRSDLRFMRGIMRIIESIGGLPETVRVQLRARVRKITRILGR